MAFKEIERIVISIIDPKTSAKQIVQKMRSTSLLAGYRNLACLLAAEGLRRRNCKVQMQTIMKECSNPVFRQMFCAWITRCEKVKKIKASPYEYCDAKV